MIVVRDKVGSAVLHNVVNNDIQGLLNDLNFKPNVIVIIRAGKIDEPCFRTVRETGRLYKIYVNFTAVTEYNKLCLTADSKSILSDVHDDIHHGIIIRCIILGLLTAIIQESDIVTTPVYDAKGGFIKESPFYNTFASLYNFMTSSIISSIHKKWVGEANVSTKNYKPYITDKDGKQIKDLKVKNLMTGAKPFVELLLHFHDIIDTEIGAGNK